MKKSKVFWLISSKKTEKKKELKINGVKDREMSILYF